MRIMSSSIAACGVEMAHGRPRGRIELNSDRLGKQVTIALDFARAFAAVYVVLHHVAQEYNFSHGIGLIFRFGKEAVMIFFLLSGFVIFANEHDRATEFSGGYYLRRLRRIYPVLLIAMVLSTLVAIDDGRFAAWFTWRGLIGTFLSVRPESS